MVAATNRSLAAGTRVKIAEPMSVPSESVWESDNNRTSNNVKKRLQELFFKGDRRIQAEVIYITSETERVRLRRKNLIKVQLRDPAGSIIQITASPEHLKAAS